MAKYINRENTIVTHGTASGKVEDLIRLGYLDKDEPIEPYSEPVPSAQDKINELEAQQTARLYREAYMGVKYSIDKLAEIDAEITKLRLEL